MSEALCYVYAIGVMRDGKASGPVKFGMSAQPFARLRELQTGNPFPLVMLGMLAAPDRATARRWEHWIHYCHPDKAMAGEWYAVDAREGVEILGYFVSDESATSAGRGEFPDSYFGKR